MNNDLISRSELIKALNEAQVEFDEYYKGLGKAKVITDNAPAVESYSFEQVQELVRNNPQFAEAIAEEIEEKTQGKWIPTPDNFSSFICSVCEKSNFWSDNFCPNCGAKMKGGAE